MDIRKILLIALLSGGLLLGAFYMDSAAAVQTTFLYNLSNLNGPIKSNGASISIDKERDEIYVVDPEERDIGIFNETGMEVFRFGGDGNLGSVVDVDVDGDGNILVLSKGLNQSSIIICDFRGEPVSVLEIKNLPWDFSSFIPDRLVCRYGRIYLLDSKSLRIAITNAEGFFETGYDLAPLLGVEEEKRGNTDIGGFSLDPEGNILFTVPVLFSAFKLTTDGKLASFGKAGSAPGRFGLVGGIVGDDRGNIYVADRLKCVILIFDKEFQFQLEFGYRGLGPENLIGPNEIALDNSGRLYVSQLRNRGVSVFKITHP